MRKLLEQLNVIARWRARREREQRWREEERRVRNEEDRILGVFLCRPSDGPNPVAMEEDVVDIRQAILDARETARIDLRTKDILVTMKVKLPRRFWQPYAALGRKHTEEAKATMRAAQRKRRDEAMKAQANIEAMEAAETFGDEEAIGY